MNVERPSLISWLNKLNITVTSPTNRLYPNGLQQVRVTVEVEVKTGREISFEELKSVGIAIRNDDFNMQPLPLNSDDAIDGWFYSAQRNTEYQYYPDRASAQVSAEAPNAETHYLHFYIMNKDGIGDLIRRFYVSITKDGVFPPYYTNGSESQFSSNVDVLTEPPPRYTAPDNYDFKGTLVSGSESSGVFVREYYLAIASQGRIISLASGSMSPAGMIQWTDRDPEETRASHVGYALPGKSEVKYNTAIRLGSSFSPIKNAIFPKAGFMTLVLESNNRIPYDQLSAFNHGGPCRVNVVDIYGNSHGLNVRFKDNSPTGRFFLDIF